MNRPWRSQTLVLAFLRLTRVAVVLTIFVLAPVAAALGAEVGHAKRVLMLFSENKYLPGNTLVEQAARNVLEQSSRSLEFYAEYLDAGRFPGENYYRVFRQYLQEKYAQRPPDLILAFLTRQFDLAGQLPAELFPKVPVVFGALTNDEIPRKGLGANVTGVVARIDAKSAIGIILEVQPETQKVVVIGGTAPLDQLFLSRTEEAARLFSGRMRFDFWTTRPMSEITRDVALLPPKTVILFTNLFRDVAGETFFPERAASLIAASASVPVYAVIEPTVGGGAIGGKVTPIEAAGRRVGELAQRVLAGTPPASLPIEFYKEGVPIFDWRALKRWGISESRLPPQSIIRFREPSVWEQYRWYIVVALSIIAIQAAMIGDLLVQRRRRRRAEADLRESEQRMSLAASAANLALWTWEIPRDEIWVTPEGRSLFGWEKSELINLPRFIDTLHPEDREPMQRAINRSLQGGDDYAAEYRIVANDGAIRWIAACGRVELDVNRRPLRMRGISIDVTERKRAEEQFRLAVEASPNAIVMVNQQGEIVLVNAQTETLFGYAREELVRQSVEILVPERFRGGHPARRAEFFAAPQARAMGAGRDLFARRKDGSEFLVEIGLNPIQTAESVFVLTAIVDITERKRAESELQRNREELAHVTRVSALGELAASLAHELNQPLTAILSNAQAAQHFLAARPANVEEVREILTDIVEDNNRAGEVIRRMRALVKKEELVFTPLDLASVIRDVVQLVRSDAILRNVRVSLDFRDDLPVVRGDKVQLQQVMLNLLLNAFEAMKDCPASKRQIVVEGQLDGARMVEIVVSDHGTGLTSDKLEKIFQPFFTTKRDGLGMGLSISRSIVEAHGGRLWAENNQGRGAIFHVVLPAFAGVEQKPENPA